MDYEEELENEKSWLARTRVNPEKFFFFYEKYYDRILGYILHFTSDRHLAEDLTSETFLKAQQNLWRFRWQKATFGGWLFKIASNEVTQHFRRFETRHVVHDSEIDMPAPQLEPLSTLVVDEDLRLVIAELKKWKSANRTIFMLRFWQGLSVKEIAVTMGIPEGTVKTKLARGRLELKDVLASMHGAGEASFDTEDFVGESGVEA